MASPRQLLLFGALTLLPPFAACLCSQQAPDNSSAAPTQVTVAVGLPGRNLSYLAAWPRVGPALSLALEALEPELHQAGLAVRIAFASSEKDGICSMDLAELKAAELVASHDPDLLLGFGCHSPTGEYFDWFDDLHLPLLTTGTFFSWPPLKTTVNICPMRVYLGGLPPLLHHHFNWTRRALLVEHYGKPFYYVEWSVWRLQWQHRLDEPDSSHGTNSNTFPELVEFIRTNDRVVYIEGPLEIMQQIMCLAQAQNMTNGDYVFFYLDFFGESLEAEGHRKAAKPWQNKMGQDIGGLREAFQTVLVITFHSPMTPKYQHFQRQLNQRAQKDFGVLLNDSLNKNLMAGFYHDGLLLYIRALNETLREGGTKRNASRILEKMRDLKIQGVTGTVSIGPYNRREMEFDLWSMVDVESGEYQVVGHYMRLEKQIKWTGPIHWKKGGPPLDNPLCIFNRDDPSRGTRYAFSSALFTRGLVAGGGGSNHLHLVA